MRITITALGSRGDIQPFLALAVGLQQAGHHVTLAAPHTSTEWARAYGVTAHPVRFNPQDFMQTPEFKAIVKSRNILRQLRMMRDGMGAGLLQVLDDFHEATQTADFVVSGGGGLGGVDIAGVRNLPLAFGCLCLRCPRARSPRSCCRRASLAPLQPPDGRAVLARRLADVSRRSTSGAPRAWAAALALGSGDVRRQPAPARRG
jgi:hypothetical protein